MTAIRAITENEYLKEVFSELESAKSRVLALRKDLALVTAGKGDIFAAHDRHLMELAEYIDWKLQVLEKGTPFDWKAAGTVVESVVSVRAPEKSAGPDFSGGYIGG